MHEGFFNSQKLRFSGNPKILSLRFIQIQALPFRVRLNHLKKRDENDINRKLDPLINATDAVEIPTDDIGIDEVTELLMSYVKSAGA